jgi:hypothetical protein
MVVTQDAGLISRNLLKGQFWTIGLVEVGVCKVEEYFLYKTVDKEPSVGGAEDVNTGFDTFNVL